MEIKTNKQTNKQITLSNIVPPHEFSRPYTVLLTRSRTSKVTLGGQDFVDAAPKLYGIISLLVLDNHLHLMYINSS